MKTKLFNALLSAVLIGAPVATNLAMSTPILADTITLGSGGTLTPTAGIVDLDGGTESTITIKPSSTQGLEGRKFKVYALFKVTPVGDGFNYEYNDDLASEIQTVLWGDDGSAIKTFLQNERKVAVSDLPSSADKINARQAAAYLSYISNGEKDEASNAANIDSNYRKVMDQLAATFKAAKKGVTLDITSTKEDGTVELQKVPTAFYMFAEEYDGTDQNKASSLIMVNNVAESKEFIAKDELPSVNKKLKTPSTAQDATANRVGDVFTKTNGEANDYEANETIEFETTFTVPSNIAAYETYKVVINDTMEAGLVLDSGSVQVKLANADDTQSVSMVSTTNYELNESPGDGKSFTVTFTDLKPIIEANKATLGSDPQNLPYKIVVEYTGHLDPEAIKAIPDLSATVGGAGFQNKVNVQFSNHPDSTGSGEMGETSDNTTLVYTFNLDVDKIDGTTSEPVEGAKFKLYSDEAGDNEVHLKKIDDHTYAVDPAGSDELESKADGTPVTIIGLDEGDYWLEETAAPAGYALLNSKIKVTISPSYKSLDPKKDISTETNGVLENLSATGEYTDYWNAHKTDAITGGTTNAAKAKAGTLTIPNEKPDKLASTGSNTALLLSVLGLGLLGTAVVIGRKGKKESE